MLFSRFMSSGLIISSTVSNGNPKHATSGTRSLGLVGGGRQYRSAKKLANSYCLVWIQGHDSHDNATIYYINELY